MILAQITQDPAAASEALSVWALTMKGGLIMIPIGLCSIVAVYIFFERLVTINKANKNPDSFIVQIKVCSIPGRIISLICLPTR